MAKYVRDVKDTPLSIINSDNTYNTGTFKTYFKNLNFRKHKRKFLSNFLNKQLLTEWQAIEVLGDDVFLLCAVFKFNLLNKTLFLLYDRKEDILYDFSSQSLFRYKSHVAPSLEKGSLSIRKTKHTEVNIINEFDNNQVLLKGFGIKNDNKVEFDLKFKIIAEPSNFVFPMTNKHTVYTEKDLLSPEGTITFNDTTYTLNQNNITILDDHRGYYPLSSGYDWITCMGDIPYNNKQVKFGINLTDFYKNKDREKYSENGFWLDKEFIHLPPVSFKRIGSKWYIKDKEGKVDLIFTNKHNVTQKTKVLFKIDYLFSIGELTGSILDHENKPINIKEMFALGEKRITQFLNTNIYDKEE